MKGNYNRKPEVCRVCGAGIIRPDHIKGKRPKERLCPECNSDLVTVRKWRKLPLDKLSRHVERSKRVLDSLIGVLNERKEKGENENE